MKYQHPALILKDTMQSDRDYALFAALSHHDSPG